MGYRRRKVWSITRRPAMTLRASGAFVSNPKEGPPG